MWKLLLLILVAVRASNTGRLIHESSSDEEDWVAGMQEPVFADEDFEDEDEVSLSEMFEQQMREEEMAAGKDEFSIDNGLTFALWINADCDGQWLINRKTSSSSETSANVGVEYGGVGVEAGGSHSSAQSKEEAFEYTKQTSGFTLVPPGDTEYFYLPSCLNAKVFVWIRYQNSRKQWVHPRNGWQTKMGTYTATWNEGHLRINKLCAGDDSGCGINGGLDFGDGDCDHSNDCKRGLICGKDNCTTRFGHGFGHRGGQWDDTDDCCTTECRHKLFQMATIPTGTNYFDSVGHALRVKGKKLLDAYYPSGSCPTGWTLMGLNCYSPPFITSEFTSGCAAGNCGPVYSHCTNQGAHVGTRAEMDAYTGSKPRNYGVTSTYSGNSHWLTNYGWHVNGCCGNNDRYAVCVKPSTSASMAEWSKVTC